MPPYKSTLRYIDLAPSDSYEEHSSQSPSRGVVGCIIDLTGSNSEGEHAPMEEEVKEMGRRTWRSIGWWRSPSSQRGVRKKRCLAQWRTPSSLFARTGCVPGSGPRTKV
jgi:hypothetical protein